MDSLSSNEEYIKMQALYGENKELSGEYDKSLSAVCENGTFVGKEEDGVLSFLGIPFAKPPVGALRWRAPEPTEASNGVYEAYYFGKSPIQEPWPSERASYYKTGEDCLYLNVWADKNTAEKKPVMVFIHGGAYGYGGTVDPLYYGHNFVKEHPDVILVTIAYRVGIMGFVDFSSLPDSEGYEDSCNLGLLDQVEALRWINKNISAFGGDCENITIFGESAGGGSVSLLPIMDSAKGLFKRVIAQSGSICLTYCKEESQLFTKKLLKKTGVKTLKELLDFSEEELYKVNIGINADNCFPQRDGRILPLNLYKAYKEGKSRGIDMMSGTNKDECRYWIGEMNGIFNYAFVIPVLFENQCKLMSKKDRRLASKHYKKGQGPIYMRLTEFENDIAFRVPAEEQLMLHSDNGGKAYNYYWTFPSALKNRGACHAVELSSVFNNLHDKIYTGDSVNEELAREVRQMWVNFAKTGDPSTENHKWPEFKRYKKKTMVLGNEIFVKDNLLSRRTEIIQKLLKYEINGSYAKLNLNISYVWFFAVCTLGALALIILLILFL